MVSEEKMLLVDSVGVWWVGRPPSMTLKRLTYGLNNWIYASDIWHSPLWCEQWSTPQTMTSRLVQSSQKAWDSGASSGHRAWYVHDMRYDLLQFVAASFEIGWHWRSNPRAASHKTLCRQSYHGITNLMQQPRYCTLKTRETRRPQRKTCTQWMKEDAQDTLLVLFITDRGWSLNT